MLIVYNYYKSLLNTSIIEIYIIKYKKYIRRLNIKFIKKYILNKLLLKVFL